MIMNPANPKILEILAEAGVKTVTTSAGSPKAFIRNPRAGYERASFGSVSFLCRQGRRGGVDGLCVSGLERRASVNRTGIDTMVLIPWWLIMSRSRLLLPGYCRFTRLPRRSGLVPRGANRHGFYRLRESPAPKAWKEAILKCSDGSTVLLPLAT